MSVTEDIARVDLAPLVAELGEDVVVTDPERMDKYLSLIHI